MYKSAMGIYIAPTAIYVIGFNANHDITGLGLKKKVSRKSHHRLTAVGQKS
jgi:hypothetical protein